MNNNTQKHPTLTPYCITPNANTTLQGHINPYSQSIKQLIDIMAKVSKLPVRYRENQMLNN